MNDEPRTPLADDPQPADGSQPQDPKAGHKKETPWMVATGVLALAVIGLAIWGFSTKSDLDKARDDAAKQKTAAGQQSQAAQAETPGWPGRAATTCASFAR